MRKVIREIMLLVWKLLKLLFWKWVRPIIGRVVVLSILAVAAVIILVALLRW